MTRQKGANLLHYYMKSRFSHNAQKTLIFDALLLGKAGFLMTHQRGAKLLHYYMKSRFSNDPPKNSYI